MRSAAVSAEELKIWREEAKQVAISGHRSILETGPDFSSISEGSEDEK
jgi:hypothetical protein